MSFIEGLSTTEWSPLGPAPIDGTSIGYGLTVGRIEAAVSDPGNTHVVYAAASDGGIWKTGTWGNDPPTWIAFGDDQQSLNFSGYHPVVVHPVHSNLVFGVVSGKGAGLLKSINGGISWELLGNTDLEGAAIGSLAVVPADDPANTDNDDFYISVWYGGPGGGIYKSTGGQHWTNISSFHAGGASDVIAARSDPHTLFAGLIALGGSGVETSGLYKVTESGNYWTIMDNGLPTGAELAATPTSGPTIRIDSSSEACVVASYFKKTTSGNVVVERAKSTSGGDEWWVLGATPGAPELRAWHHLLAVNPTNPSHIVVNDQYSLYQVQKEGDVWKRVDQNGDDWVNASFDANGEMLITADRNIYHYDPKHNTWKRKEGNLQVTLFYTITPDPNNPEVAYGVAQDHPQAMRYDGTSEWTYINAGGETGKVLVDPTNSRQLYVSDPLHPAALVRSSPDGGDTWNIILVDTAFKAQDYALAYSVQKSFVIDRNNADRLLIGTNLVWETTNASTANPTWQPISDILGGAKVGDQYITALAIAPSDSQTIYAATSDGHVWITPNGGTEWFRADAGLLPSKTVLLDIRIHPKNSRRGIAVGTGEKSVWALEKVGTALQWKNIAGNLAADLWTNTIFADWQLSTSTLYLGTSRGAYRSIDDGKHWDVFGSMPKTNVMDLQAIGSGGLCAATAGRGAWVIRIGPGKVKGRAVGPGHVGYDIVEGVILTLNPGGYRTITNRKGFFDFGMVPSGTYAVHYDAPAGFRLMADAPRHITVDGSSVKLKLTYDFDAREAHEARADHPAPGMMIVAGRMPNQPLGAESEFRSGDELPRQ